MVRIVIEPLDGVLKRFGNQIGALGEPQTHRALARAVNRTTSTVHGRVIKAIRKQSDIPTAIIRRSIKKRLVDPDITRGGKLEGVVWSTGKPISLRYFKPRQMRWGTKAKWGGQWHRYPSAFMGPKPGAIAYKLRGNVFVRTSGNRFPIERLFGPSVPEELVRSESARVFQETVADMLPRRIMHELSRMLSE